METEDVLDFYESIKWDVSHSEDKTVVYLSCIAHKEIDYDQYIGALKYFLTNIKLGNGQKLFDEEIIIQ